MYKEQIIKYSVRSYVFKGGVSKNCARYDESIFACRRFFGSCFCWFSSFFYQANSREFYVICFIKKESNQKVRKIWKNTYFCFFFCLKRFVFFGENWISYAIFEKYKFSAIIWDVKNHKISKILTLWSLMSEFFVRSILDIKIWTF